MTGTPLDLTPFGSLLQGIGLLYWLIALAALIIALRWPRRRLWKLGAAAAVVVLFGYVPLKHGLEGKRKEREFAARHAAAAARFEELCKSAGIRIERREQGIEGLYLMKVRPERIDHDDQFSAGDVYGHALGGDEYIRSFLRVTQGAELKNEFGETLRPQFLNGYAWVEANDLTDGKLYRYRLVQKVVRKRTAEEWEAAKKNGAGIIQEMIQLALEREPIDRTTALYGVTWEDIATRQDREHWIAGGAIRVIDLRTNHVIAERRGYMWDRALGNRSRGRQPWQFAQQDACPPFPPRGPSDSRRERTGREAVDLVNSVLQLDGAKK